jgi:hypothetical protein
MFAEINGIQMRWEEFGEGEPLLWLHGLMGVSLLDNDSADSQG